MTELRYVTSHMGSHSVTCYPTQVNAPRPNPSPPAGTWFTYLGDMEDWVNLSYPAMERLGVELATSQSQVRRPNHNTTERPRLCWYCDVAKGAVSRRIVLQCCWLQLWGRHCVVIGCRSRKHLRPVTDTQQSWATKPDIGLRLSAVSSAEGNKQGNCGVRHSSRKRVKQGKKT